jgi:hypothetical protein
MKKMGLCLLVAAVLLSCGKAKGNEETAAPAAADMAEKHEEAYDTPAQPDKGESVHYTRKELNEKFNPDGLFPLGVYFWDEFGFLKSLYDSSEAESEILGRWGGFDVDWTLFNNYYGFYPNKLFIVFFQPRDYCFYAARDIYLDMGLGVWEIENNKVVARLYCFVSEKHRTEIKNIIPITPYRFEVIDMEYIDPAGYSRRPFNRFKLPVELEDRIKVSDNVKNEYLMVRRVYGINTLSNDKNYLQFDGVPDMAREGVSGLDIVQSPELIKKYLWNF